MSAAIAWAIPAGIGLGLGLWVLASLIPRLRGPRLVDRVAPFVLDVSADARELIARRPAEPSPAFGALAGSLARPARVAISRILGGDEVIAKRLRQAGRDDEVERFRSRQLLAALAGAVVGAVIAALGIRAGTLPIVLAVAVVAVGAALGLLAPEQLLARAARRRGARISEELPTVLEFLTLSLAAGEGLADALRRVARAGNGELARELGRVIAEVNSGIPLATALTRAARTLDVASFARTVDQLVPALDRGTPLVEVLRAQAQDVRGEAQRALIESAGKKEVAMLVPLVFLILPVTVLFAIFPGILVLQLGF
ncbi:type II secretion system F family protein [Schumannella luteola]|uniref:Tight adherence protein C n=1 Tax=Schumannella luteola TaxID=472059 RepID=A0A852YQR5_9MICO|nr:type II secretion system F family protein [Schumannella luteola]NYG99575.1 tight adherence protein C [Schumannella luteola]TPX01982.1 type II secretion system F family protein [Schumannella luteola]